MNEKFLELCDWGAKLAWINVLWLLYSLAGGVVLGVFPATAAAHQVIRLMLKGEDVKAAEMFRTAYRKEWKKANKLGISFFLIGAVLYVDYSFFRTFSSIYALLASYLCFILLILWFFGFISVFSMYANYESSTLGYVKNSFYMILGSPLTLFMLAAGLSGLGAILFFVPGLLPFFAVSVPVLLIEWACSRRLQKLQALRAG